MKLLAKAQNLLKSSLFMRKASIILLGFGLLPKGLETPAEKIAALTLFLIFSMLVVLIDIDYRTQRQTNSTKK